MKRGRKLRVGMWIHWRENAAASWRLGKVVGISKAVVMVWSGLFLSCSIEPIHLSNIVWKKGEKP